MSNDQRIADVNVEDDRDFWKARANRLRWALVDIATGDHDRQPITTLEQAQRVAHNALEAERDVSAKEGR